MWFDIKKTPPSRSLPIVVSDGRNEYFAKALWVEGKNSTPPKNMLSVLEEHGVILSRPKYRRSFYSIETHGISEYKSSEELDRWRFRT